MAPALAWILTKLAFYAFSFLTSLSVLNLIPKHKQLTTSPQTLLPYILHFIAVLFFTYYFRSISTRQTPLIQLILYLSLSLSTLIFLLKLNKLFRFTIHSTKKAFSTHKTPHHITKPPYTN